MRWGIIGYGSIGKKHAENILLLNDEVSVVTNNKDCPHLVSKSIHELVSVYKPEAIIISNETSKHIDAYRAIRTIDKDVVILIEKPIFEKQYLLEDDSNTYVAYCLRFHPLTKKIKNIVQLKEVISARFYVGQYLPNWRSGRDYKEIYSAKKELGGGVLRDLSHEIDLANYLLGNLTLDFSKSLKVSNLDIDCDDLFAGSFHSKNCPSILIEMNYIDRICQREFVMHTSNQTWKVDFISGEIKTGTGLEVFSFDKNEMYLEMLKCIKNKKFAELATFHDGIKMLDTFQRVEKIKDLI